MNQDFVTKKYLFLFMLVPNQQCIPGLKSSKCNELLNEYRQDVIPITDSSSLLD